MEERDDGEDGGGVSPTRGFWSEIFKMGNRPTKSVTQNFPTANKPLFLSQKVNTKAAIAEVEVNAPPHARRLAALLLTKVIKSFSWLMATSPPPWGARLMQVLFSSRGDAAPLWWVSSHARPSGRVIEPSRAFELKPKISKSWNLTLKCLRQWGQQNSSTLLHSGFVSRRTVIGLLLSVCFFEKITYFIKTEQVFTGHGGSRSFLLTARGSW